MSYPHAIYHGEVDYLYVPPGGLHSFKNNSDELAEGKAMTGEEPSAFFVAHDNLYA